MPRERNYSSVDILWLNGARGRRTRNGKSIYPEAGRGRSGGENVGGDFFMSVRTREPVTCKNDEPAERGLLRGMTST